MGYTVLAVGLVLIVAAWACYQYPNLINPYGGLPPERKEFVDIEGLKKACAIILGITGFLLVVTATINLLKLIDEDVCGVTLMVLVFVMMVPLTIAMKRHNAFGRDQSRKMAKSGKAAKIAWGFMWVVMVIVAVVLALSFRPTRITVGEETIKISGMYGREILIADIVSVELLDEMPPIRQRTNGSDTGNRLKGHFVLKSGEKSIMYIRKQAPYIEMRTTDNLYYFNADSEMETDQLFQEIKNRKQ